MRNKAKKLSKRIPAFLLSGMLIVGSSCTSQSTGKKKHLSGRQILDKMYLEFILNENFDALYTATETPTEAPSAYLPYEFETVKLKQPIDLTLSNPTNSTSGIFTEVEGMLPNNFNLTLSKSKPSAYIMLHTSAERLNGKYGTLTSPFWLSASRTEPDRYSGHYTITRHYKNKAVEFVDPSLHAVYSAPFPHPQKPNERCVFVGLQFTISPSTAANPENKLHYRCAELVLLPYSEEALEQVLNRTKNNDAIHKVAQNLLKQIINS